jgi:hypothetical protein
MAQLQAQMQAMQAQMQAMQDQTRADFNSLKLSMMRAANRQLTNISDYVTPLDGVVVEGFPETLTGLSGLTTATCNTIITQYSIENGGNNLPAKKRRIAQFIGLHPQVLHLCFP